MIRYLLAAALAAIATPAPAQTATTSASPAAAFLAANRTKPGVVETPSGLQYQVLAPGDRGAKPGDADVALVIYEGRLTDGTVFDKSPWFMPMPVSAVVPGFAEALKQMPNGARYRFWIKPELAYGAAEQKDGEGKTVIPANAVLVFEVRMLDFVPAEKYYALMSGAPAGN